MTFPISQPADNAAAYTWTQPIRDAIGAVNTHETSINTINTQLTSKANTTISTNIQSGTTYTLVLADASKLVEFNNAAAVTVTIPTHASVAIAVGSIVEIQQLAAGQVTCVAAAGVTFRVPVGLVNPPATRGQNSVLSLRKRGQNEWVFSGDLA